MIAQYRLLTFRMPNLMSLQSQTTRPRHSPREMLRNIVNFYADELLAPHPIPQLEEHSLSAVCYCLFNIFAATLHIGYRSSNGNLMTRHTMVAGTQLYGYIQTP